MPRVKKINEEAGSVVADEAVVEAVSPVEAAPALTDTVSVEMSEKEKQEFVAFKAKQAEEAEKERAKGDMYEVDLKHAHYVNFEQYGPGRVKLPNGMAQEIMHRDQQASQARLEVMTQNKHEIQMFMGAKSIIKKVTE